MLIISRMIATTARRQGNGRRLDWRNGRREKREEGGRGWSAGSQVSRAGDGVGVRLRVRMADGKSTGRCVWGLGIRRRSLHLVWTRRWACRGPIFLGVGVGACKTSRLGEILAWLRPRPGTCHRRAAPVPRFRTAAPRIFCRLADELSGSRCYPALEGCVNTPISASAFAPGRGTRGPDPTPSQPALSHLSGPLQVSRIGGARRSPLGCSRTNHVPIQHQHLSIQHSLAVEHHPGALVSESLGRWYCWCIGTRCTCDIHI